MNMEEEEIVDIEDVLNDPEIASGLNPLIEKSKRGELVVSDIIQKKNGDTLQYVDIVMEGGGVLGAALIGYIYALEQVGIRFLSIGGTSAGSIAALTLASCSEKHNQKSLVLFDVLFNEMKFFQFIDGDDDAKDVCYMLGKGEFLKKSVKTLWKSAQVIDNLIEDIGLNPGDNFLRWLKSLLARFGIRTLKDLNNRIETNPVDLIHRETNVNRSDIECKIGIVAADITTETKVIFPQMAPLYWENPDKENPAIFVRASMSIPLFFHPFKVEGINSITDAPTKWKNLASYETNELPDTVFFADGGVMSGFPIDIFHEKKTIPEAPTFGVRLDPRNRKHNNVSGLLTYVTSLVNSVRHFSDFDFIIKNQDYNKLIGFIDTSKHNGYNFFMKNDEKKVLFKLGVKAAVEFLEKFNWSEYKEIRRKML